ncbi:MAG: DUF177 domain-containing protein [Deltaproteobacteria bacterium]|nr:DUF177 domain-containing protein [Deltaproteobacteria bacterium]
MIVDLQNISRSPRQFDLTFQPDWWREGSGDIQIGGLEGPLGVKLTVSRDGERFIMNGRLGGQLRLVCDRCLETYAFSLSHDFRLSLALPESWESIEDETELKIEDLGVGFISTTKIDLDDIIREQIYLALPIKALCENTCAGLCSRCGVNLNQEPCRCSGNSGHPAFLKLKELPIR